MSKSRKPLRYAKRKPMCIQLLSFFTLHPRLVVSKTSSYMGFWFNNRLENMKRWEKGTIIG